MRVLNRLQFAFLLLLCPPQLNCSTSWQPPRQGLASPLPWQRRLITVTKTSRDALHYGLLWKSWTHVHNKTYSTSNEGLERYVVWRSNTAYIQYHNTYADKFGFTMAMNSFGDQTAEEYNQNTRCVESHYHHPSYDDSTPLPDGATPSTRKGLNVTYFNGSRYFKNKMPREVDWRADGAVTDVKDQGRCKSCYAFASIAAVESMHALATGELLSLSEQNIIDCSIPYGNRGCSGGSRLSTIMYMVDNGGVDTSATYPYIGRQYLCRFSEDTIGSGCTGVVHIKRGNEHELLKAVAVVGPVTVAVDSRHTSFQFYSDGVYSEPSCSRSKLTHTMLLVGYGTTNGGRDYWLLKNSWGVSWGQEGYIMMSRNYANQCGIASKAMYVTL